MEKVIIGVTGTKAAGKDEFVKFLKEEYNFATFSLADIVREKTKRRGLSYATPNLQNIGNELRRDHGNAVLAEMTAKKIISEFPGASRIVINSIRNPVEVRFLRKKFGESFYLLGIDADEKIRRERYLKREGAKNEDFEIANRRDLGEAESYGQQVSKCLSLAEEIINNSGTLEELREKTKEVLCRLGIERPNLQREKEP